MSQTSINLEQRRLRRLAAELTQQLLEHRSIAHGTDYVEDVELWRRAVRLAGREIGIPVRTGVSKDGTRVWASEGP